MKKILIFSFFCLLCFTTSFAQKVKPVNYGGSVNLMEVRGRWKSHTNLTHPVKVF